MAFLFAMLLAVAGQATEAASQTESAPNVLLLYADDLGFGDLSCLNADSRIPTPHLDRLASQGMTLLDGHSSSGICTPSRYALLTGRYHWRDFHGIVKPFGPSKFEAERLTLPELLRGQGYATACIGKWHLGWNWGALRREGIEPLERNGQQVWGPEAFDWSQPIPDGPLDHGFDHYFGDSVINFPPYTWIEDNRVLQAPDAVFMPGDRDAPPEGHWEMRPGPLVTGWDPFANLPTLTERAVAYVNGRKGQTEPFFLYVPLPSPHAPIVPVEEHEGASKAGPYGDYVVQTDAACGAILDALEGAGLDDNTIVIFSSDNGPERYAYARQEKTGHWSSEPFRGLKRDLYEGGHHVPFLVRWPGKVEPGSTSAALVSQVDLMATIAGILGVELPSDAAEDSHDLLPLLLGEAGQVRAGHVHNTYAGKYAFRQGPWVLVEGDGGHVELYHLGRDPGQRTDVAGEHPGRLGEMSTELARIREAGHSAPRLEPRRR